MVSEDEAVHKAEETLRFGIGSMPHLTDPRFSDQDSVYVFQIRISYPRLPEEEDGELEFDAPETIGELSVDAETGEVTHTPLDIINARVRDIKQRDESERRKRT